MQTPTPPRPDLPTPTIPETLANVRDTLLTTRLETTDEPTRQALWDAAAKVEAARRRARAADKKAAK